MRWNRMIPAFGLCLAITAGQAGAQEIQLTSDRIGILKKWMQKSQPTAAQDEIPTQSSLYFDPHLPPASVEQPLIAGQPVTPVAPMVEEYPESPVVAIESPYASAGYSAPPRKGLFREVCTEMPLPNIFGDTFASDRGLSAVANSAGGGLPPSITPVLNPSEGVVGRQQIAHEANPLPTDRIYFIYDYFDNVPLVPGDIDVSRYVVGIEKTFLNGFASIDVRIPWATTADSASAPETGAHRRGTEFGNLFLALKVAPIRADNYGVSGGLGISVPTGDDTRIISPTGVEMLRIDNETVILTPFVAGYWTNNLFFAQMWSSIDFDTSGNSVLARPAGSPNMMEIGRLNSQNLFQIDAQVGMWLLRNDIPGAFLRGVAPFFEFHYNSTVSDQDTVTGFGNTIGDFANHIDEINLSSGLVMEIGEQSSVSVGAVLPVRGGFDRSFDYQVGVRANFRFGVTALTNPFGTSRY